MATKVKYGVAYNYVCPDNGPSGQFLDSEGFTSKKAAQTHLTDDPHGYFGMGTGAKVIEITKAVLKRISTVGDVWPGSHIHLRDLTAKEVIAFRKAQDLNAVGMGA